MLAEGAARDGKGDASPRRKNQFQHARLVVGIGASTNVGESLSWKTEKIFSLMWHLWDILLMVKLAMVKLDAIVPLQGDRGAFAKRLTNL